MSIESPITAVTDDMAEAAECAYLDAFKRYHSNTSVTQKVYARFLPEHLADSADVLNFGMAAPKAVKVQ